MNQHALRHWTQVMPGCAWCGSVFPAHRCHSEPSTGRPAPPS